MIVAMPGHRTRGFLVACFAALGLSRAAAPPRAAARQSPAGRIVAVGDIHGATDSFAAILQAAGLVSADWTWSGGTTTLVQTGDYLDRGGAVRQALDLLIGL